jgi:hypothetical protein
MSPMSRTCTRGRRESGFTRRIHEIRKRAMGNFTEEGLREEAEKIDWNKISDKIGCTKDLDRSTEHLEATIRHIIKKVAPVKIVKKYPRHIGDWCTAELKDRVTARNEGQKKKKTKEEHRDRKRQKNNSKKIFNEGQNESNADKGPKQCKELCNDVARCVGL